MLDLEGVERRFLSSDCSISEFSCGRSEIDEWLKRDAAKRHDKLTSRVTTFHKGSDRALLGFYSLRLTLEPEKELRKTFDVKAWTRNGSFPALNLEFLGVCERHQEQGLGRFIMTDILDLFCDMAEATALPLLTLTPLDEGVAAFYAKRNFVRYGSNGAMMLDARTAIRARDEILAGG